jgi:GSH-dependent disulfide-bond oxidoreductase
MIDLYFWPTGNGKKISIMLEECGLPYRVIPVNINKGDQSTPEYLSINPNGKMPAIVDHDAPGRPLVLFESGAILQYLGEKSGQFLPQDLHGKYAVLQWVYWQVAGLGPNAGQAHHFLRYYPERLEYPMHRFQQEVKRLYTVMDQQLARNEYLAGDYSIADMAAWPWVVRWDWQGQNLDDHPNVKRWFEAVGARPGVQRGAAIGADLANFNQQMSDEDKKRLFNLRDQDLGGKPA